MKWLHVFLAFMAGIVFYFTYHLWFDEEQGVHAITQLEEKIAKIEAHNQQLEDRNNSLEVTISSLKNDVNSQEELARYKLGLIQEDETFYQILPEEEENKNEK